MNHRAIHKRLYPGWRIGLYRYRGRWKFGWYILMWLDGNYQPSFGMMFGSWTFEIHEHFIKGIHWEFNNDDEE